MSPRTRQLNQMPLSHADHHVADHHRIGRNVRCDGRHRTVQRIDRTDGGDRHIRACAMFHVIWVAYVAPASARYSAPRSTGAYSHKLSSSATGTTWPCLSVAVDAQLNQIAVVQRLQLQLPISGRRNDTHIGAVEVIARKHNTRSGGHNSTRNVSRCSGTETSTALAVMPNRGHEQRPPSASHQRNLRHVACSRPAVELERRAAGRLVRRDHRLAAARADTALIADRIVPQDQPGIDQQANQRDRGRIAAQVRRFSAHASFAACRAASPATGQSRAPGAVEASSNFGAASQAIRQHCRPSPHRPARQSTTSRHRHHVVARRITVLRGDAAHDQAGMRQRAVADSPAIVPDIAIDEYARQPSQPPPRRQALRQITTPDDSFPITDHRSVARPRRARSAVLTSY